MRAETEVDWDPEKTWVFAVGLLQWERPDLWNSFPAAMKDRRDQQLVEFFRDADVPDDQIVYLQDAAATKQRIEREFVKLLDDTDEVKDLLVFYFLWRDGCREVKKNRTWFANYDAGDEYESAWNVQAIVDTIEKHFNGDRVLLMADCCHSGALYDQVRARKDSELTYASSSLARRITAPNSSTGHWTFSDCVLAGLRGDARVDLDGDKVVNLQELAHYGELELAFCEGQKSMFLAAEDFPRKARLAAVDNVVAPARRPTNRSSLSEGKWYKAETIDARGNQLKVHYVAELRRLWTDEWVGPERVRPYQPAQFAEGDKVQVRWDSDEKWYPATVLASMRTACTWCATTDTAPRRTRLGRAQQDSLAYQIARRRVASTHGLSFFFSKRSARARKTAQTLPLHASGSLSRNPDARTRFHPNLARF